MLRAIQDFFTCAGPRRANAGKCSQNGRIPSNQPNNNDSDEEDDYGTPGSGEESAERKAVVEKEIELWHASRDARQAIAEADRQANELRLMQEAAAREAEVTAVSRTLKKQLPEMPAMFMTFFACLLSCATYTYSLPLILPAAASLLAPDDVGTVTTVLYCSALSPLILVPFVNDYIDRRGECGPIVQVLASFSVLASILFLLAFKVESVILLWLGTIAAATSSQLALFGVTAAMVATFITVHPERAGRLNSIYMLGMFSAMPFGAFATSFLPLAREGQRGAVVVDVTVFNVHLFLSMVYIQ